MMTLGGCQDKEVSKGKLARGDAPQPFMSQSLPFSLADQLPTVPLQNGPEWNTVIINGRITLDKH